MFVGLEAIPPGEVGTKVSTADGLPGEAVGEAGEAGEAAGVAVDSEKAGAGVSTDPLAAPSAVGALVVTGVGAGVTGIPQICACVMTQSPIEAKHDS